MVRTEVARVWPMRPNGGELSRTRDLRRGIAKRRSGRGASVERVDWEGEGTVIGGAITRTRQAGEAA
jgi:hypothetical protein